MGYTVEEIRDLENPYQDLGNGDALAMHREELNKLTPEEQMDLASRMVLGCPNTELKDFFHAIEATRNPSDDTQTFHSVLASAYEVKKRIFALQDPRNKNPHLLILGNEFDEELFGTYHDLAMQVLDKNETSIAERLAITTPTADRNQLALNVKGIFPNSLFATKLGHAFAIRRDIDNLLLTDHPELFFSSREFSIDGCIEFKGLFQSLTEQDATNIAQKLALHTPEDQRNDVSLYCQKINAADDTFSSKVREAFALRRDIDGLLLGEHPEEFFSSRDFSVDACLEFSTLFSLLKGQEQAIGKKLSLLDEKTRADINRKLEMINNAAHDQSSSFRLIASAMSSREEVAQTVETTPQQQPAPKAADNTNPYRFYREELHQRRQQEKMTLTVEADEDQDQEEEESCLKKFCGFLS
ncbi:lpg0008 family Dot/Icm T4SS effector [Legionella shakespearei]|uniref:Uncharacterized protein n=1 Tax=Legionella shakespearei DSM 23087 TaxID=1122169 RepID=A0A0W0Z4S0_9GAMM|nr:lpg0008 family Dot/Icm T4SS effector [Legionella shakespearei]KTD64144.1 hypothetical protein Lsha_0575 [Legionella shakespearei DSM 23087]